MGLGRNCRSTWLMRCCKKMNTCVYTQRYTHTCAFFSLFFCLSHTHMHTHTHICVRHLWGIVVTLGWRGAWRNSPQVLTLKAEAGIGRDERRRRRGERLYIYTNICIYILCMYVCMYVYIYIYVHIYINLYAYKYIHMYTCIYIYRYVYVYVYICICI